MDETGDLEFLGRIDDQVKVRGHRIELGEIEAALRENPGVEDAAAVVKEPDGDDARLVAFVVSRGEGTVDAGTLLSGLRAVLPAYMVPTHVHFIETMPLNVSGKIDRRALVELEVSRDRDGGDDRPPEGEMEILVANVWSELLGFDQLSAAARFFEIGGHSLLATRVISRLSEALEIEIPLRTLFERPVLADLAEVVRIS